MSQLLLTPPTELDMTTWSIVALDDQVDAVALLEAELRTINQSLDRAYASGGRS